MARRTTKQLAVVDSLSDHASFVDTPDDDSTPLSQAKRDAAQSRHVNQKKLAAFLDRDRTTIGKWIEAGMPYVVKANRDIGQEWIFDTAEVVRWREQRAAADVADKLGGTPEGATSEEEAKRRRQVAQAVVAELDMLERLRAVVPIDDVLDLWSKDYAEVRAKCMSLPDVLAANVDPAIASIVKAISDKHIRETLDKLKTGDTLLKWK